MGRPTHAFRAPDGTEWGVEVDVPGSSNAVIYFRHPGGDSVRLDRYNWVLSNGPEARSVTSRLRPDKVMDALTDDEVEVLFRRSMPIMRRLPRARA
jgi:hypothetical protein